MMIYYYYYQQHHYFKFLDEELISYRILILLFLFLLWDTVFKKG